MLKLLVIGGIIIIGGITTALMMSEEEPVSVADAGEPKLNVLIGSGKEIQGRFTIGYAKCNRSAIRLLIEC